MQQIIYIGPHRINFERMDNFACQILVLWNIRTDEFWVLSCTKQVKKVKCVVLRIGTQMQNSKLMKRSTSNIDGYILIIFWNKNMQMLSNNYEIPLAGYKCRFRKQNWKACSFTLSAPFYDCSTYVWIQNSFSLNVYVSTFE